ncbi:MAG: SLC13/DASS family transporter [Prosthecobacter sp.]|jgi:sodium-dependent dicarboxylate transporter 2/3/5|uniref:SLC13 family permease n=1 Tax=Prosthecobacter sp. TaxID=1965333 RepID=UPI001A0DA2F8|nr:DASS family sodium-coupled anion symporter [Prosthecobacter sp.]MBE2284833.1 SLC13/DASS family transporter [Prosthecobacter sp.]
MIDTRAEVRRILKGLEFSSGTAVVKFTLCAAAAWACAFLPLHEGLSEAGRWSMLIVLLGAGLWITEAVPAFAVALLIIGLQIVTLGRPGGPLLAADDLKGWEMFVRPWSSPPMWLFFGGLVLAVAATRTGMDRHLAQRVIRWSGGRVQVLMPAMMGLAFGLSMFMSNTATTALLLVMLRPALDGLPASSPVPRSLLLGLAVAANLGGMATLIGTPPNAIAAGLLEAEQPVDFLHWMLLALPPAGVLAALGWMMLSRQMAGSTAALPVKLPEAETAAELVKRWQRIATAVIFLLTVALWMSGEWHGIPTAVVSFVPIVVLSMIGVMRREDIKSIDWDVLILLAGGLSLGVGIETSGLAKWLASGVGALGMPSWAAGLVLAWMAALVSNLMSNTAAANILLPVTLVIAGSTGQDAAALVIPVALGCSVAMALPISTPPNALVYSSGRLRTTDYLPTGLLMFLLGPPLAVFWCRLVVG